MNIFDRIPIIVDGYELYARPIEFDFDKDRNPIAATKYEATCSSCGSMLQFVKKDLIVMDDKSYLGCNECGVGFVERSIPKLSKDLIKVEDAGQVIEGDEKREEDDPGCPFWDPMEANLFNPVKI
jgi:hypothetical protein